MRVESPNSPFDTLEKNLPKIFDNINEGNYCFVERQLVGCLTEVRNNLSKISCENAYVATNVLLLTNLYMKYVSQDEIILDQYLKTINQVNKDENAHQLVRVRKLR